MDHVISRPETSKLSEQNRLTRVSLCKVSESHTPYIAQLGVNSTRTTVDITAFLKLAYVDSYEDVRP